MAYKFKAIEKDKETLVHNGDKTKKANQAFGETNINELIPSESVRNNIEENGIQRISLDLIKPREVNNFRSISSRTLKASIKALGLLDPILIRTIDGGKYMIIAGHRRFNAFKEILADLKIETVEKEKRGESIEEINERIDQFSRIPAIIFTVVEDNSELLGTNAKYITADQEEKIYQATNLENRQISKLDLAKHVKYFYDLINDNPDFKKELLDERNKNAKRKAVKFNYPEIISDIIVKEEGFSVSHGYIWKLVTLIEKENEYPKYHKKAMKRIDDGESVKAVFDDFSKAVEIINYNFENREIKQEYMTRIEKGNEPITSIYNELFDIKQQDKKRSYTSKELVDFIYAIDRGEITAKEVIKMIGEAK